MPRKTRRRIRGKRVRGTRRVRIYYRGGNRTYYSQGGDMFGEANNMFSNAAARTAAAATNLYQNIANSPTYQNIANSPTYKRISSGADTILKNASSLVGFKTNDSQLFTR
jgi:hypothetical protein